MRLPRFGRRLHIAYLPACGAATDALIDAYVAWREACARVHIAYGRWDKCEPSERDLSFAAYLAALDREQYAAREYARRIERVRRLAISGHDHEVWGTRSVE